MIKRFNRFELKYVVTTAQADAVRSDLLLHMQTDPHGSATGGYFIESLYYDTPDLAFLRAKQEGIKFRRKLRIRRYGSADPDAPVFVEIKQRINRTTQKRRLDVGLADAYALCEGARPTSPLDDADAAVAGEVVFLVEALRLRPVCLIGYRREAFVGGRYEPGLRVTFDDALWASPAADGLAGDAPRHALLSPDRRVLEVKANNAVPVWLAGLLARHGCHLDRYSKYGRGAERLLEAGLVSAPAHAPSGLSTSGRSHG